MKKVYTITFQNADNYGAVLQAYALQKAISKKYKTEILNYDNKSISNSYKLFKRKNTLKDQIIQTAKDLINFRTEFSRKKRFNAFRKHLNLSQPITNNSFCASDHYKDSIYITGSDQVWNEDLTGGIDDLYFLNPVPKEQSISYAASVGSLDTIKHENDFIKSMKQIKHLSVRERPLKEYLDKKLSSANIKVVLDPTLLLSKKDWESFAGDKRIIKEKYVFVYCGEEPKHFYDIVNDIAKKEHLTIVYSWRRDKNHVFLSRKRSYANLGPKEFANLIRYAECVVTSSFHGTALSVIFNKRLYAVLNRSSNRLTTLLKQLSLDECIITNYEDYTNYKSPDWDKANTLLKSKSEDSMNWLYDAIEDCMDE